MMAGGAAGLGLGAVAGNGQGPGQVEEAFPVAPVGASAASRRGPHRHIDAYGADPTGERASDDAFDAAVEEAREGDWILMTHGRYRFDRYHRIEKALTLYGEGAVLQATHYNGDPRTFSQLRTYRREEAVFAFFGKKTDRVGLDGDHRKGTSVIRVKDISPFKVGDTVLLNDSPLSRLYRPSMAVVRDIRRNDLYLDRFTRYAYRDGDNVERLDPLRGARALNLTFRDGTLGGALSAVHCRDLLFQNCTVDGYRQYTYRVTDCLDVRMIDCCAFNALNRHGGHGEPFAIAGSCDVTLVRPRVRNGRRLIDLTSGCNPLRIIEPHLTDARLHALSFHSGRDMEVYGAMEVFGGVIAGFTELSDPTQREIPLEWLWGNGCNTSENADYQRFFGTSISGGRYGIAGHGRNVECIGCVVSGGLAAAQASGEGHRYTGTIFEARGERPAASIVDIDGARDLRCEGARFIGDGAERCVRIGGKAENIHISGEYRGLARSEAIEVSGGAVNVGLDLDVEGDFPAAVRLGECRDVRISGHIRIDGVAVELVPGGEGGRDLRIDGLVARGQGKAPAVLLSGQSGGAGAENLKVVNCDFDGAIRLNAPVEGLWLTGNTCSEIVVDPGSLVIGKELNRERGSSDS